MHFPRLNRLPLPLLGLLATAASCLAAPQIFTIKTLPAQMRYDVTDFVVKPGAEVKILFENPDDMPHNIVFFQPGTDVVGVCNKQMEKPDEALKRNWLPEDSRMWMHSKTLNPREKEELVFKAPEKTGDYPFVCSMPGHAAIMNGVMHVYENGPIFTSLDFSLYLGDWQTLPDFTKLTPHRSGAVESKLVELKLDDYKNQFGLVFTGKLEAPQDGDYTFELACDDGGRVIVDDKKIVEHDGVHPASETRQGIAKLKKGTHDVRIEYFQAASGSSLYVGWAGPKFTLTPLSTWTPPTFGGNKATTKKGDPTGMPLVVDKEPVIYRNFIAGAGNRGIGIGYPGQMNIAWNTESMNLALVWRGAFIDAAKHWTARGGGTQRPLGYDVLDTAGVNAPPFATLVDSQAEWPKLPTGERLADFHWKGYTLDARRFPTFNYEWKGVKIAEKYDISGDAVKGAGKLTRTLKLTGDIPQGATFRVIAGTVRQQADGKFLVDAKSPYIVECKDAQVAGNNLLVPARPEIVVTYAWPETHAMHVH